ncbi:LOW QUALITY PROTEIN: hypothetical protein RJ641_002920 [Dillenia turbinata]|uniref:Uncharacterized protein n=1 Tax=Dillenia turbinata TaxID=194707 RepID=A0AAN8ZAX7_9MAGN
MASFGSCNIGYLALGKKSFFTLKRRIEQVTNFNKLTTNKYNHRQKHISSQSRLRDENLTILPTVNDEEVYEHVFHIASHIVGEENIKRAPKEMGSEDLLSTWTRCLELLFFWAQEMFGSIYPPHSPFYVIDEDILPIGAALHATFAHSYLSKLTYNLRPYR